MHIDHYSFGSMTVGGEKYTNDLIIFPEKVRSEWWRKEGHLLSLSDLKEVIDYLPEELIIGKGAMGVMQVPEEVLKELGSKGIKVTSLNTKEAALLFNEREAQGKKVVGAFHLTC